MIKKFISYGFFSFFLSILLSGLEEPLSCSTPTIHETWQTEWNEIEQWNDEKFVADIVESLKTQPNFIMGAATAEYQILGKEHLPHAQMAHGEESMVKTSVSGRACGDWKQHFKDITLLEECGLNGYRFSIDWSAIEPKQGHWDKAKLQHYIKFCKELRRRNIKVMVTLHHFVHPQWFEELGAFEKHKNIKHFVNFCKKVFLELAPYVDQWCTINEPGIYVFQSYIRGVFPPFRSVTFPYLPSLGFRESWAPSSKAGYGNIKLAGQVLFNLLNAHVEVYETLHDMWTKNKDKIQNKRLEFLKDTLSNQGELTLSQKEKMWAMDDTCPPIGFVHQYLTFRNFHRTHQVIPYQSLCAAALFTGSAVAAMYNKDLNKNLQKYGKIPAYTIVGGTLGIGAWLLRGVVGRIEESVANILNNWINWSVMNFFQHGEFNFIGAGFKQSVPQAKTSFDFAGLNYYSVVSFNLLKAGPDYYKDDIRTEMPYGIYAEGLYRAIQHMSQLDKPIYITENGIAEGANENDTVRKTWIKRHFWAIKKAIDAHYDIRGFFYWSLLDNWEWDMGYGPKFGLYSVAFDHKDLKRTLREGSKLYQKIALKNSIPPFA